MQWADRSKEQGHTHSSLSTFSSSLGAMTRPSFRKSWKHFASAYCAMDMPGQLFATLHTPCPCHSTRAHFIRSRLESACLHSQRESLAQSHISLDLAGACRRVALVRALTSSMALEKDPKRRLGSSVKMGRMSAATAAASDRSWRQRSASLRCAANMACLLYFWTSATCRKPSYRDHVMLALSGACWAYTHRCMAALATKPDGGACTSMHKMEACLCSS